jgi:hypothetical protein
MAAAAKRTAKSNGEVKSATPWGAATVVERASVSQRAGEKRFASVVELLEGERGERFVRFAYTTGGAVRRGPVTLRLRDLERLLGALPRQAPTLAGVFGVEDEGERAPVDPSRAGGGA